jgi:hypothetical protein
MVASRAAPQSFTSDALVKGAGSWFGSPAKTPSRSSTLQSSLSEFEAEFSRPSLTVLYLRETEDNTHTHSNPDAAEVE